MSQHNRLKQGINLKYSAEYPIEIWLHHFLIDRHTRGLTEGTQGFYRKKLAKFVSFCDSREISSLEQVTAHEVRSFLLWLEERGHNAGGIHAFYRALRTFLLWWHAEVELTNWKNPFSKVPAPRLDAPILAPIPIQDLKALLKTCENDFFGKRDRAMLLALLDCGARAGEFLSLDISDVQSPLLSAALLKKTKSRKARWVFFGQKTRKALRKYLQSRKDDCPALWVSQLGTRLTYAGMRQVLRRRANRAGIAFASAHAFRRAFALAMLREGVSIYELQRLMGHADLQVLERYLDFEHADLEKAHRLHGPVDNL